MPQQVILIPIDRACAEFIAQSPEAFAERHDLAIDGVGGHMSAVISMTPAPMLQAGEWGTFFAYDAATRSMVGACGFKAPPDAARTVEIAYFTFPPREGRGWGTTMARALTARALASAEVDSVIAHTLPETNASTRVLEKCGFRRDGKFVDPEDGPVWRWRST